MYLLDTDTIIYILKGNRVVENNLQRHYHDPIKISVITLMELYYGAYKSQKVTSKESRPVRPIPVYKAGLYGLTENRQLSNSNPKPPFIPVHRTGHSGCFSNLAKIKTLQNSLEIIPLGQEIAEIFGIQKANLEK